MVDRLGIEDAVGERRVVGRAVAVAGERRSGPRPRPRGRAGAPSSRPRSARRRRRRTGARRGPTGGSSPRRESSSLLCQIRGAALDALGQPRHQAGGEHEVAGAHDAGAVGVALGVAQDDVDLVDLAVGPGHGVRPRPPASRTRRGGGRRRRTTRGSRGTRPASGNSDLWLMKSASRPCALQVVQEAERELVGSRIVTRSLRNDTCMVASVDEHPAVPAEGGLPLDERRARSARSPARVRCAPGPPGPARGSRARTPPRGCRRHPRAIRIAIHRSPRRRHQTVRTP